MPRSSSGQFSLRYLITYNINAYQHRSADATILNLRLVESWLSLIHKAYRGRVAVLKRPAQDWNTSTKTVHLVMWYVILLRTVIRKDLI